VTPVSFSEVAGETTAAVAAAGSTEQLLMLLLLVLPMAGFVSSAVLGRRLSRPWIIAVPTIIVVWAIASYLAFQALIQGA